MNETYPRIKTENLSKAEIFNFYLKCRDAVQADYIETKSTNCVTKQLNRFAQRTATSFNFQVCARLIRIYCRIALG